MENRNYNLKDEELVVIAGFILFSLKRDLAAFFNYSPKFNDEYVTDLETKINDANEIVNPKSDTVELKLITARLYKTIDSLIDPMNRVNGYIKLAKKDIPVSLSDFGLTFLRRKVASKDAEGVLHGLKTVNENLVKYKTELVAQGLSDEMIAVFTSAAVSIAADNQLQYEIMSKRKKLVEQNLKLFNGLYSILAEICDTGKILYKGKPEDLKEYTFTELKKRVRAASRKELPEV